MKKRSVNSRKYSLLFATFVALFSICTAGVSTFAWFQATSAVQIAASSSSTTISVSKPDDVEVGDPTLYAYNANFTEDGGVYDNHGYNAAVDPNKVSMLFERGESSYSYQTYYTKSSGTGGFCVTYTKALKDGKVSIIPEAGFEISSITFDTIDTPNGAALYNSIWENGTPVRGGTGNNDKVIVTPTDGNRIVAVSGMDQGIKLESVTIHYSEMSDVVWDLTTASFAFCGGIPKAQTAVDTNYDSMAWVTAEDPARVTDATYFTQLTDSNKAALLSSSKLAPGYKLSYAAKLVVTEGSPTNASFYLKKYTSTQLLNRFILSSPSASSGNQIRIDEAMKVCTSINTTGWFFGSNVNQFTPASVTADSTSYDTTGGNVQTKVYNSEAVGSLYEPDQLGTFENFTGTTVYFFFTIEFSNEPSTDFYYEYTAVSGSVADKPRNDYEKATTYSGGTKYYKKSGNGYVYDVGDQPSSQSDINTKNYYLPQNRYFLKNSSGTSNCYAGLTFQINKIELTLS